MFKSNTSLVGLLLILGILLMACSGRPLTDAPILELEQYEGRPLHIAVIGELPSVREQHIQFSTIQFTDLLERKLEIYDAVFITKEHLNEASEDQYANVYMETQIPFFFIDASKSYYSFIEKDFSYEENLDLKDISNHYIIGLQATEEAEFTYWYFGLYDDIVSDQTIKGALSQVFMTIEKQMNF
ncbi:hypothetical protein [Alkalihalobacterium chitinilyticum]|uniref:Uncharacterized protein n=1 Tax=Alkalihalobacterium chitinilyticum TaxID=2980103 RepID=A0ABT5VCL9_9BACI|nr:hypothetical protein [Alkalihalobacterium chitinilyticum]MDE5413193.1 hypothetical protein [Alkalihalobacterium chitinilyticum]